MLFKMTYFYSNDDNVKYKEKDCERPGRLVVTQTTQRKDSKHEGKTNK